MPKKRTLIGHIEETNKKQMLIYESDRAAIQNRRQTLRISTQESALTWNRYIGAIAFSIVAFASTALIDNEKSLSVFTFTGLVLSLIAAFAATLNDKHNISQQHSGALSHDMDEETALTKALNSIVVYEQGAESSKEKILAVVNARKDLAKVKLKDLTANSKERITYWDDVIVVVFALGIYLLTHDPLKNGYTSTLLIDHIAFNCFFYMLGFVVFAPLLWIIKKNIDSVRQTTKARSSVRAVMIKEQQELIVNFDETIELLNKD